MSSFPVVGLKDNSIKTHLGFFLPGFVVLTQRNGATLGVYWKHLKTHPLVLLL
jgi:hypothetical protein